MFAKTSEVNDICSQLGRYTYFYEPSVVTTVNSEGRSEPKVVCKAYPDRSKAFHNVLSEDVFEDKYYLIKEKWESYQYDNDNQTVTNNDNMNFEAAIGEDEPEVFGLQVDHKWE